MPTKKTTTKSTKETATKVANSGETKVAKKATAAKTTAKVKAEKAVKVETKVAKAPAKKDVKAAAKSAPKATKTSAKVAKAETKTAEKAVKAEVKAPKAKSAPSATEQTDVKIKATAKRPVKEVKTKVPAKVKANAKPITQTASLAQSFDAEYLVLMQKDPNWMQAFWDVSEKRIKNAKKGKSKLVLRLFDVSKDLTVKRSKKVKYHDIEVPVDARSWYVENKATHQCKATLGFVSGKKFEPIVEAAPIATYALANAEIKTDDVFVKASLGNNTIGGFASSGLSSVSAKNWLESLSSSSGSLSSGALSSGALTAAAALENASKDSVNYGKDFFLWVKTRLIVYGGTRPDAHLQVRGEDFPLNPDGTFSFEEDLPDSTKIIPVFATDKDGDFPTTIVPIVVKRTE